MAAAAEVGDMPTRVRKTLEAGADMALICNNPDAVAEVLEELEDLDSPGSYARLAAMRPHAPTWALGRLHEAAEWKQATAKISDAAGRPALVLNG
jgi:beta-N-acetylhexosaminidase